MLTKSEAAEVVRAVQNDPECRRRINSFLSVVPASLGISGSLRNVAYMAQLRDPSEKDTYDMICVGIAEATSLAIKEAAGCRAGLGRVTGTDTVDRSHLGTAHTATLVKMVDGKMYVFDWHATLNVDNPQMYSSTVAFSEARDCTTYSEFVGFDLPSS